ncbi:MAG TPA: NTP transferase domain-containing protein [Steroidobacteraceae bacterium]|nr:NTP transferase domain-containing protein [Steroidobacteraceae bacterium]
MIPMNARTPRRPDCPALPRLQVVLLAAGFSSRLGRPKALVRVGALSLLRRSLILAAPLSPCPVGVVVPPCAHRYRGEARRIGVRFIVNRERAAGLSTSVRRGIAAARFASAVLIVPVDLAGLSRRDLIRLVRRWRAAPRRLTARRISSSRVRPGGPRARGGVPLILPKWLFGRALEASGDAGLRDIIDSLSPQTVTLVDLPSAELDVDTADDLAEARRRWLRGGAGAILPTPRGQGLCTSRYPTAVSVRMCLG